MASVRLDSRFRSDHVFNDVSKHFITLKDKEMSEYNVHLKTVLNTFIETMKKDNLFRACFRRIAYVGSYYEGLKVGKPEEFDLNVIINLPINYTALTTIIASERPGYIKLKADADVLPNLRKHVRWPEYNGGSTWQPGVGTGSTNRYYPQRNYHQRYEVQSNFRQTPNQNFSEKSRTASQNRRRARQKAMDSWFHQGLYLDQNKFRQWFESVVTKALGSFECVGGKYVLKANGKTYLLHHKKSGPAWTLRIDVPMGHTVDVDLVPVLEFTTPPPKPFINHKTVKQNWFAVSKPLDGPNNNILWRPSFYEREGDLLKGGIKQVIRQMKKLRDTQNFKSIASYYIKTLFLRELEDKNENFQKLPSTFLFYYMLQKFRDACVKHEIYDFWNPRNNLLSNISQSEMGNIRDRLNKIIIDIDKRIGEDCYVIAQYILSPHEFKQLKSICAMTKEELLQLKLLRLPSDMAAIAVVHENAPQPPPPPQNNGYLSAMWNSFWGPEAAPAPQ